MPMQVCKKWDVKCRHFKLIKFPDIVELAEVVISSNNISIIHEVKVECES